MGYPLPACPRDLCGWSDKARDRQSIDFSEN
jgi:hypothetical protein